MGWHGGRAADMSSLQAIGRALNQLGERDGAAQSVEDSLLRCQTVADKAYWEQLVAVHMCRRRQLARGLS